MFNYEVPETNANGLCSFTENVMNDLTSTLDMLSWLVTKSVTLICPKTTSLLLLFHGSVRLSCPVNG